MSIYSRILTDSPHLRLPSLLLPSSFSFSFPPPLSSSLSRSRISNLGGGGERELTVPLGLLRGFHCSHCTALLSIRPLSSSPYPFPPSLSFCLPPIDPSVDDSIPRVPDPTTQPPPAARLRLLGIHVPLIVIGQSSPFYPFFCLMPLSASGGRDRFGLHLEQDIPFHPLAFDSSIVIQISSILQWSEKKVQTTTTTTTGHA